MEARRQILGTRLSTKSDWQMSGRNSWKRWQHSLFLVQWGRLPGAAVAQMTIGCWCTGVGDVSMMMAGRFRWIGLWLRSLMNGLLRLTCIFCPFGRGGILVEASSSVSWMMDWSGTIQIYRWITYALTLYQFSASVPTWEQRDSSKDRAFTLEQKIRGSNSSYAHCENGLLTLFLAPTCPKPQS